MDEERLEARFRALESEVEALMGFHAMITVVLKSLIAKHHDHDQFKMLAASAYELMESGHPGQVLTERQRRLARTTFEQLLSTKEVRVPIDPLRPLREVHAPKPPEE